MNIENIYFFTAVIRHGSLSKAASKLGVSPQTVGRKIAKLEYELGTNLFIKHPTGYQPTTDGLSFYKDAETVEKTLESLQANFKSQQNKFEGVVRVALPEMLAIQIVIPQLQSFIKQYPKLELQIVTGIFNVGIARGDADIALRLKRPEQGALTVRKVGSMSSGMFVSKGQNIGLDKVPLIGWDNHIDLPAAKWLTKITKRSPSLRFNTLATQEAAIRSGLGAGILPHFLSDGLTEVEISSIKPESLWLVSHASETTTPRIRAVYDEIANIISANQNRLNA
ncbi:LysR family transcriptional regulator [Shewanella psychropiezotolerans]|uniref:LysR family transcriptional regulator n=1 Tax=Shewanella psychropiezotolerans TaxID=2593655 RepID=A0ABX5WZ93_9GAMM|nr:MULTISPECIES: LysR family transcriptional regulator [Shewanella]MPY24211.1 LysR family transcriptional regulator [Shewanella sp. YLB-07]QDO84425.1 LysR family transcriptional regulator [Shewanella psychropiezotolerans]